MSQSPVNFIKLSETLSLCEYKSGGYKGFWLYDKTRRMDISMCAKTEKDAFVEALHYYQERLTKVEQEHATLKRKVVGFCNALSDEN